MQFLSTKKANEMVPLLKMFKSIKDLNLTDPIVCTYLRVKTYFNRFNQTFTSAICVHEY